MKRTEVYTDLKGRPFSLAQLDEEEWKLLHTLAQYSAEHPHWIEYRNFWLAKVGPFYDARGVSRQESHKTILYRVAQDIGSRLAVAGGHARAPDYRDELEELIRTRFATRRDFCEATGISEDMLSHVLARRKHLAIDTLAEALEKIGYRLQITPRS